MKAIVSRPTRNRRPDRTDRLRRVAETLAIAAAGGATLGLLGVPAGLAVRRDSRRRRRRPSLVGRCSCRRWLTRSIFVVIGISLGAVVTPQTLHGVAAYSASILALIVAMIGVSVAGTTYLYVVHGWEAAVGLSRVFARRHVAGAGNRRRARRRPARHRHRADYARGDHRRRLAGRVGAVRACHGHVVRRGNAPLNAAAAKSDLGILVDRPLRLRRSLRTASAFPAGLLFGAMLTSGACTARGLMHAVMPSWAAIPHKSRSVAVPARVLPTCRAAADAVYRRSIRLVRGSGRDGRGVRRRGGQPLSLHRAEVMIAFAPGSVDAMMLLALALNLDPVYVGAHHVTRILLVSVAMPLIVRRSVRRQEVFVDEEKPAMDEPRLENYIGSGRPARGALRAPTERARADVSKPKSAPLVRWRMSVIGPTADISPACHECPLRADYVEKVGSCDARR